MKPKNDLFELIKSLSGNEKRYFKLSASVQKGNKNYLKLFDAIDSQTVFDEELIRRKYRRENFVKNLTSTKNYLYKLIFKSLNAYYNEKSLDTKMNNLLNRCRLLYDKALFNEYFRTVQAGKEMASRYEMFSYLLQFLEIERQLTKKEDLKKKNMDVLYDEELSVIEKIKTINNYKRAVSGLFRIYWLDGTVRDKATDRKIDLILSDKFFNDEKTPSSLIAKERFYFALYLAHDLKGNAKVSFEYNKKRFLLISKYKKVFQKFIFDNYEESFLTLVISAANAGEFKEAEKLFERYNKTFQRKGVVNLDSLMTFYVMNLSMMIVDKKEADYNFIYSLERFLITYKGKLNIDTYNYTYYNLSRIFFLMGNFEEALRIINIIFDGKYLKHTPRIEPYVRILNILIHYELANFKLLSHLISSTTKYLKNKNKLFKTESITLNFIKKVIQATSPEYIKKAFPVLRKEFELVREDKYEKNAFIYFDFIKWADKKLIN